MKWMLICGALLGALAVAFGAFGAHALKGLLDERALGWYDTAVTYHSWHALALLACGLLAACQGTRCENLPDARRSDLSPAGTVMTGTATGMATGTTTTGPAISTATDTTTTGRAMTTTARPGRRALTIAALAFLGGILVFSGSLYAMAFTGLTRLGMITPIGGVLLIAGWIAFAVAAARLPAARD